MKKNTLKSVFAALAVSAVAVSATSAVAFASDYSDAIKTSGKEVAYDGSAYTTDKDTTNATQAKISIEKKEITVDEAKNNQTLNVSVSGADKKYASVGLHFIYDTRLKVVANGDGEVVTYNGKLGYEQRDLGNGELFVAHDGSSDKGTDGEDVWQITFQLPADVKGGEVFPVGIEYRTAANTEDCFTNALDDENGKLMQAYVFTKGITNGYIKVAAPVTETTTTTTETTSTETTTTEETTTTTSESTTSTTTTTTQNDAPPTGVAGVGVAAAGLAVAIGTAFALRKRED